MPHSDWIETRPSFRTAVLVAILLLALSVRLIPWGQNRFLEDEALYAVWGLQIATGADPMLDHEPVDKPPLHPYSLALSFLLLSSPVDEEPTTPKLEAAARFPSLLASIAGIALVYALGSQLYGAARVGLVAAALLALSPYDILFASTAFTDPLMTALVIGALVAASHQRLGFAGLLVGMAAAAKQQGLFFLPLIVALGLLATKVRTGAPSSPSQESASSAEDSLTQTANSGASRMVHAAWNIISHPWIRFVAALTLVIGSALIWDSARLQRPGFYQQSLVSYGGIQLAQPGDLIERGYMWLQLVGQFWASPWFGAMLAAALGLWLWNSLDGRVIVIAEHADSILISFIFVFLLVHWLVGFQVWDRYLLGLVPLVALLAARALTVPQTSLRTSKWHRYYLPGLAVLLVAALMPSVAQALRGEIALGGDHGAYDGIDEMAEYIKDYAPEGAVLYHTWLGYHHRFYLYDAPLRLHWYPDLADLARDATVYRREPRYVAFPSWRDGEPAETALAIAGIQLEPVADTTRRDGTISFRLFELGGP